MNAIIRPEAGTRMQADRFDSYPDGRINGMFDSEPTPLQRFAGPLLANRAHVLVGLGGTSKTRLLYSLGIGAALGRLAWSWQVHRVGGSAALFLTEDTTDDVHRTVHEAGRHLTEEERMRLAARLRVYPLAGRDLRLLSLVGNALHQTDAHDWLMSQISRLPHPISFIGLDPALALTEGNELEQVHQRCLGQLADRIAIEADACVLLNAHAAKGLQVAEEIGSHLARGGGALTDAVRGELVLRTMTAEEGRRFGINELVDRKRYVQLHLTKANHVPPEEFAPIWLRRGPAGLLGEASLLQVERGTVGKRELDALEILRAVATTGASSLKFWREQCAVKGAIPAGTPSAQEKAMERIRDVLRDAGMVHSPSRGLWEPA